MRVFFIVLSYLGAHFSLTAIIRAGAGKASAIWPFAKDTKPAFTILQNPTGETVAQLLSVIAATCFIVAIASIFGKFVPTGWWTYLMIAGAVSSVLLYLMHINLLLIIPLLLNLLILYGVLLNDWNIK